LGYFACQRRKEKKKEKKERRKEEKEKPHVFQNSKMREVTFCKGAL
jgi:hypothetical protein